MTKHISLKLRGLQLCIAAVLVFSLFAVSTGTVSASNGNTGVVYTMTNANPDNTIQVYARTANGALTQAGIFSTGGSGTGISLGSQGAIYFDQGRHLLFTVNAGSNEISVFAASGDKLRLLDKVSSRGSTPLSLTVNHNLLYVLDSGGSGNIAGFRISSNGHLAYIPGSTRSLSNHGSGAAPSPEEIGFTPDGSHLLVTEKASNNIDVYNVDDGVAQGPVVEVSSGSAPYGFGFTPHGIAVISEAANSSVSSYAVVHSGLKVISASIVDTQAAACWLVVSANGAYAYAANAGSGTLSGYRVSPSGKLSLLNSNGITGSTGAGSHPIDMAFGSGSHFLYVLASGNNMINAFAVHGDGSLSFIASYSSPTGASGLAAQ